MSETETTMSRKIDEVSDGNIGVLTALMNARATIGDKHLTIFLEKVPERGEALWLRFRTFQKASKDRGAKIEMTFNHFIASVVMPNPFQ